MHFLLGKHDQGGGAVLPRRLLQAFAHAVRVVGVPFRGRLRQQQAGVGRAGQPEAQVNAAQVEFLGAGNPGMVVPHTVQRAQTGLVHDAHDVHGQRRRRLKRLHRECRLGVCPCTLRGAGGAGVRRHGAQSFQGAQRIKLCRGRAGWARVARRRGGQQIKREAIPQRVGGGVHGGGAARLCGAASGGMGFDV